MDNLRNNSHHAIDFILAETTLIRVVGMTHKHLEFDLELRQHQDGRVDSESK